MSSTAPNVALQRLHVTRYRSLKDTAFEPNKGLSVLVGPNGVGKTNLLQALLLLKQEVRRISATDLQNAFATRASLSAEYAIGDALISHVNELQLAPGERGNEEIRSIEEQWAGKDTEGKNWKLAWPTGMVRALLDPKQRSIIFGVAQTSAPVEQALSETERVQAAERLRPILEFNSLIRYYSAAHFTEPSKCPSSFEVEGEDQLVEDYSARGPHRNFVYSLYRTWKRDKAAYERYMSIVGPEGIALVAAFRWKTYNLSSNEVKVRLGGKVVRRRSRRTLVIPMVRMRQSWVAFNQLSDGTFKTLALAFHLLANDWSMLLLEEPEVCVHHGLLVSIVELVKVQAERRQIVVSTHSELVLDLLKAEQVFPVSISVGGTKVKRLDLSLAPRDMQALREYLENSGNLGEYWKHGGLSV